MAIQTKIFSTGSLADDSASNSYAMDLVVKENLTDQVRNHSQVFFALLLRSGAYNRFTDTISCTVTVAGQTFRGTVDIEKAYNHTYTLLTGTVSVTHDDDGTKTLAVSASLDAPQSNPYAPADMTISAAMALTAIPRQSTLAATAAYIEEASTIAVNRRASGYSHSIRYQFGSLTGYLQDSTGTLGMDEVKLTDTTLVFPIPETFYSEIPDAPDGVCTLTCTTYAGDTVIGSPQTAAFTVTAKPALCAPLITGTAQDVNEATLSLTGDERTFVKYLSRVLCTPQAQAQKGAALTGIYVNGEKLTESTYTMENITADAVVFRAEDSRGYSTEYTVPNLSLVAYVPISCTLTAGRTDPDGNCTFTVEGKYFADSFGLQDNALQGSYCVDGNAPVAFEISGNNGNFCTQVQISGLDYLKNHSLLVTVSDAIGSVEKQGKIGCSTPVFDWGESDFAFHVPVLLANGLTAMGQMQSWKGADLFTGDANEVLDNAFLITTTGAQNCSQNGLLLVFGWHTLQGRISLQFRCVADGTDPRYRLYWYDTWTPWKSIATA